jgi:hypothetical protein
VQKFKDSNAPTEEAKIDSLECLGRMIETLNCPNLRCLHARIAKMLLMGERLNR